MPVTVRLDNAGLIASAAREAGATRVTHLGHREELLDVLASVLRGGEVVLCKGANSAALFETASALAATPIPEARPS
ncbi:hypothetical protein ACTD5D_13680 [Nocardia takedensis]|uniref:hypothetical protein n=1 Tax=Nocardia takedensis TaxID=259390 RepID=UPI0002DC46E4|nr:hypothetical protein [Nocardia takedensis]